MINCIKVFFCAVIIRFSQHPRKMIKCRFIATKGNAGFFVCEERDLKTRLVEGGTQRCCNRDVKCLISMGGNGSHEARELFCFYCGLAAD